MATKPTKKAASKATTTKRAAKAPKAVAAAPASSQ